MRKTFLFILLIFSMGVFAQDQTINGILIVNRDLYLGANATDTWGEGRRLYFRGTDASNDPIWLAKYTLENNITDLRVNIGDDVASNDRFVVGATHWQTQEWYNNFVVTASGRVGINGVAYPAYPLEVNGTIRAQEVKIEATDWPDFVFTKDYQLPSLSDVEKHIQKKGTLPNIPSEQEVKENGIEVGDMQAKLLQKIEELTLYVIEQNKTIESLKEDIKELQNYK